MEERSFHIGSLKLNYVEGSPGGPPLLMLHGTGAQPL